MRSLIVAAATLFGTDPVTFTAICLVATFCAFVMRTLLPNPWMALAIYPLLALGGLIAASLVGAMELVDPIAFRLHHTGELDIDWSTVSGTLPTMLIASALGMCVMACGIMQMARSLGRYI
jgi:hypothetical protein